MFKLEFKFMGVVGDEDDNRDQRVFEAACCFWQLTMKTKASSFRMRATCNDGKR